MQHGGFTAEYIESLNPMDRKLYWAYWEQEQQEKSKAQGQYNALDTNIPTAMNMQGVM